MSFPEQIASPFTRAIIEAFRPNQFGVYGLFRKDQWIYIGQGDIRDRLLKHLDGDNPRITMEHPTHWVYEVIQNMDEREKQLIKELDPIANRRLG